MIKIVECVGGLKIPDLSSLSQAVQQFRPLFNHLYIYQGFERSEE